MASKRLLLLASMLYLVMTHTRMVACFHEAAMEGAYPTLDTVGMGRLLMQDDAAGGDMGESAVSQQTLQAFKTLANAVKLQDVGDGSNIQRLRDAVAEVRAAYETVTGLTGPAARAHALKRLVSVEQLLFKTVTASVGDLALVGGLVALAAFIMLTVAGALFAAAAGTLLGAQVSALSAANGRAARSSVNASQTNSSESERAYWFELPEFQSLTDRLEDSSSTMVDWVLSASEPIDVLNLAFDMVGLSSVMLSPEVQKARNQAQGTIRGAAQDVVGAGRTLVVGSRGS